MSQIRYNIHEYKEIDRAGMSAATIKIPGEGKE
jgi:hypothetical protein